MSDNNEKKFDPFQSVTDSSTTAGEFLQKLDLANERWSSPSELWVFRGQNDAIWKLEPSLFRETDVFTSPSAEIDLIDEFIHSINQADLPVPSDSLSYTRYTKNGQNITQRGLVSPTSAYGREYDYTHVVFALAQHSGLPTRLLDFSYDPVIAAFFAADTRNLEESLGFDEARKAKYFDRLMTSTLESGAIYGVLHEYAEEYTKAKAKLPKDLAVWAIRVNDLQGATLRFLTHSYSQLRKLRLQQGAFICDTESYGNAIDAGQSFERGLRALIETGGIHKLTLPITERPELTDILSRKKITRPILHPSYERIAKGIAANWRIRAERVKSR